FYIFIKFYYIRIITYIYPSFKFQKMKSVTDDLQIKSQLMDQLPYEVVWLDADSHIIYANAKFCRAVGYTKKECSKLSITDINVTVTPESWKNHWQEVLEKGSVRFKATHKNKGGKFYDVEVYVQSFSYNGKYYLCAVVNEIAESSFYKNLIDNTQTIANVGGWELNLHDGSILATPCAIRIFQTETPQDLTPPKIIHKFKDSQRLKTLLSKVIKNGASFDELLETNERPPRYIRAAAKPILKGDKVYKIIGIYQDISEVTQKENDLALYKTVIDNRSEEHTSELQSRE